MRFLLLDNYVDVDVDDGSHYNIYSEDHGRFVTDLLGRLFNLKLRSSEVLSLPTLSHQFWHEHVREEMSGLLEEEFYLPRLSSIKNGSSKRLASERLLSSQHMYLIAFKKCESQNQC